MPTKTTIKPNMCCGMGANSAVLLLLGAVLLTVGLGMAVQGVVAQVRYGLGIDSLAMYFIAILLMMMAKAMKHSAK